MVKDVRALAGLRRDRRGVTALEYGLIAAIVGGAVISANLNFGASLMTAYDSIGGALTRVAGAAAPAAPAAPAAAPAPAPERARHENDGGNGGNGSGEN
jgi:pilus assembly protein Flp/PilA